MMGASPLLLNRAGDMHGGAIGEGGLCDNST